MPRAYEHRYAGLTLLLFTSMDNNTNNCPFCRSNNLLKGDVLQATQQGYVIENSFSPGNFLIIPEAHITDVQQLPSTWWADVQKMLVAIPGLSADYNISLNVGALAGQTQPHLHFWVIPRTQNTVAPGKGLLGMMKLLKAT